jgi:hypothetical protein
MKGTAKNRRQNSIVWPELTIEEADRISAVNSCSRMTVYRRFTDLKQGDPQPDNITLAIKQIMDRKIEARKGIMKQLSAA